MTFEDEHVLLWAVNKYRCGFCFKESVTHTTDHARCACQGWECWARTKEEIQQAHVQHCDYLRKQTQTPHALQWETGGTYHYHYPNVVSSAQPHQGNHSLCWLNETSGYCNWCDWRLSDRPKDAIERAYQAHLVNVKA